MRSYVLVPSPLLGPATWDPVAAVLRDLGARAEVAVVDDVLAVADGLPDVVLVPHSNAGLRASWWASLIPAAATVYVDAALPPADAEAHYWRQQAQATAPTKPAERAALQEG